jgi:hypothetical protein
MYILNRSMRGFDRKTLYKAWHGETLAMHHFRTFGCVTHVRNVRSNLKKIDDHNQQTIFIRYEPGSKAYRATTLIG